jgi:hypothetical protein
MRIIVLRAAGSLVFLLFSVRMFSATWATAVSPQQEKITYVANFNYTPVSHEAPGSGGVTFTIANVSYKPDGNILWVSYPQFDNLDKAIKEDLPELLIAKGFSVRGPFDSYDLIPYSDKKDIDLYLIPVFMLSAVFKAEKTSAHCTGNIEVNGKITLELREITTRELMWVKNIPFTKFEFPYDIHIPHYAKGKSYDLKPFIMNDLAKKIEQQYPDLMATIFRLIDPEEMRIIKKQCQELRSKRDIKQEIASLKLQ